MAGGVPGLHRRGQDDRAGAPPRLAAPPYLRAAGCEIRSDGGLLRSCVPQGRKLSKKDAVPFKFRGLMSVNTPNGPLYVDKTAFDVRPRRPARRQPAVSPQIEA